MLSLGIQGCAVSDEDAGAANAAAAAAVCTKIQFGGAFAEVSNSD